MEFDPTTTTIGFVVVVLVGLAVAWLTPMGPRTVLTMVLPALVVYGAVAIALGVKHGEYRARSRSSLDVGTIGTSVVPRRDRETGPLPV